MSEHMPLNGARPIQAIHRALTGGNVQKPSAADIIRRAHLEMDDDAPDGTGAGTKSSTGGEQLPRRQRAVDPSQGHGSYSPGGSTDPLLDALKKLPSIGGF